jgi:hypothetical protein
MLAQKLSVVVGTIWAATVGVMDAALGRLPQRDGHLPRPDLFDLGV